MLYWFDTQENWWRRKPSNIQQLVNPAFKRYATFLGQFKNNSNETKNFKDTSEFETAGQLRTKVRNHLQRKVDLERDVSTQDASLQASAVLTILAHVGSLFKVILNTNDWKTQYDFKKTCHSNCQDIWVIESRWFDFTTNPRTFNPSTNAESSSPANMTHFWCLLYPWMHRATPFSYFSLELCLSTYLTSQEKQHLGNSPKIEKLQTSGKAAQFLYLFIFINQTPCYDIVILKPTMKLKQLHPKPT